MTRVPALALIVLLAAAGSLACGGTSEPPEPTAKSLTAEGWAAFEAGDLDTAGLRFEEALALDPAFPDAHTGLGWIEIRRRVFVTAVDRFDTALTGDPGHLDARAGRVLAAAGLDRSAEVKDDGLLVLEGDPEYLFSHDPDYAAGDVRWLVARAALDLGEYSIAADQFDVLSPGHGLDPEGAGFLDAALALLESLRQTV